MKYLYLITLLFPLNCLAQEAGSFGSSGTPKIVVAPPVVAVKKSAFDPCASGQCNYGKKQRKNRTGFGSRRKKAVSSFGKGGNNRRSKAIDGGTKANKSRSARRYRRH